MRLEPSSFLLFSLALLAAIVGAAPSRTKSWQQTSYYNNDENDPLKEPTSITVINHDDTCVDKITFLHHWTLTWIADPTGVSRRYATSRFHQSLSMGHAK